MQSYWFDGNFIYHYWGLHTNWKNCTYKHPLFGSCDNNFHGLPSTSSDALSAPAHAPDVLIPIDCLSPWSTRCHLPKQSRFLFRWVQWLTPVIPVLLEAEAVDHEVRRSRSSWSTWRNLVSTKYTKISWVWWHTSVAPATWEAEAGELLEPRR